MPWARATIFRPGTPCRALTRCWEAVFTLTLPSRPPSTRSIQVFELSVNFAWYMPSLVNFQPVGAYTETLQLPT